MAEVYLTFNGTASTNASLNLHMRPSTTRPVMPSRNVLTKLTPSRDGAYFFEVVDDERYFVVPFYLSATSTADAQTKLEAIGAWLRTAEPASLVFSDRTDRTYSAVVSGTTDIEQVGDIHSFTVVFRCPDPYGYEAAETETAIAKGSTAVTNNGSIECYPRFEVPFTANATFLRIETGDYYVQSGLAAGADEGSAVEPWDQVVDDGCTNVAGAGWSTPGVGTDGGTIAGTMSDDDSTFSPKHAGPPIGSFGAGATWHGPNQRYTITTAITDFTVDAFVGMDNRTPANSLASIEIYMVDASGNILGRMRYSDRWASAVEGQVDFRAGNSATGTTFGDTRTEPSLGMTQFNNKYLRIRTRRLSNVWYATIWDVDGSGNETWVYQWVWTDTTPSWGADLKYVEVKISQWSTNSVTNTCYLSQLNVYKYTNPGSSPQLIIENGDTIEFDHGASGPPEIRKNGARWMTGIEWGSKWFALDPGSNTITLSTDGTVSGAKCYHKERYP